MPAVALLGRARVASSVPAPPRPLQPLQHLILALSVATARAVHAALRPPHSCSDPAPHEPNHPHPIHHFPPSSASRVFALYVKRLLTALVAPSSNTTSKPQLPAAAAAAENEAAIKLCLSVAVSLLFLQRFVLATSASTSASTSGLEFRLFTVALMVAVKLLEDQCLVRNREWVLVCGKLHLSNQQLAAMEREFLAALDFSLDTPASQVNEVVRMLADELAFCDGCAFGCDYGSILSGLEAFQLVCVEIGAL
ncbi:hypothetical protein HDU82_008750 [Entophlyctis luteolus]|nr:hypothetical protein HDU82_008750 [Entophlyctis luteolus]